MAKETITRQYYPDDNMINRKINEMSCFGWEVISNQRCQEKEDGGQTLTTFNKVTYTREKAVSWYRDVRAIEDEYIAVENKIREIHRRRPVARFCNPLLIWFHVVFVFPIIGDLIKYAKAKKFAKEYDEKNAPAIAELEKQLRELANKADAIVNAM